MRPDRVYVPPTRNLDGAPLPPPPVAFAPRGTQPRRDDTLTARARAALAGGGSVRLREALRLAHLIGTSRVTENAVIILLSRDGTWRDAARKLAASADQLDPRTSALLEYVDGVVWERIAPPVRYTTAVLLNRKVARSAAAHKPAMQIRHAALRAFDNWLSGPRKPTASRRNAHRPASD